MKIPFLTKWRKEVRRRRRCPHSNLRGIYGDAILAYNSRLICLDCDGLLDGPVTLAKFRESERNI